MRTAQMRYVGQTYEVDTPLPAGVITKVHIPEITRAFHAAHEHEYGVSSDDFPVAFVALGVGAVGELKQPPVFNFSDQKSKPKTIARRPVYFDGSWLDTAVYNGRELAPTIGISGPAVVEYPELDRDHTAAMQRNGRCLRKPGRGDQLTIFGRCHHAQV